jgi:hypothetical protein
MRDVSGFGFHVSLEVLFLDLRFEVFTAVTMKTRL